jgi:hypothetical protein
VADDALTSAGKGTKFPQFFPVFTAAFSGTLALTLVTKFRAVRPPSRPGTRRQVTNSGGAGGITCG